MGAEKFQILLRQEFERTLPNISERSAVTDIWIYKKAQDISGNFEAVFYNIDIFSDFLFREYFARFGDFPD